MLFPYQIGHLLVDGDTTYGVLAVLDLLDQEFLGIETVINPLALCPELADGSDPSVDGAHIALAIDRTALFEQ